MYPQAYEQTHPAVPPLYPMDPCRRDYYHPMPYEPMPYEPTMPYDPMPYMPCPMMDPMLRDCIRVCMMQCGRYSHYYLPMDHETGHIEQTINYYMEEME